MAETTLPVEFLFSLRASLGKAHRMGSGPHGPRAVVDVTGGTFEGPRLRGTLASPGGDWVWSHADGGGGTLDVRLVLLTDDGAAILMTYQGISSIGADGQSRIRTAPLFQTGDERYSWLNRVQAVGIGRRETSEAGAGVAYEVYALQ